MLNQIQVGPQQVSSGSLVTQRGGNLGDSIVSELNGRYYENVFRGNVYVASLTAAAALAAASTAGGLFTVWNPANSGKNLVLLDVTIAITSVTAVASGTSIALAALANTSAPTSVTALSNVLNALLGNGNSPAAKIYTAATLAATPTPVRHLASALQTSATVAYAVAASPIKDEIAGALVVAPGSLINIVGVGGTPADVSILAAMTWAELPVLQ